MSTPTLSDVDRARVVGAFRRTLNDACPELFEDARAGSPPGGWDDLLGHLDELVAIVRRTSAERVEPYLAQILDEICTRCAHEQPSGYCPLRGAGQCVVYRHAEPILRAVEMALYEIQDEEFLRVHGGGGAGWPTDGTLR